MSTVPEPPVEALPEQSAEPIVARGVGQAYLLFAICLCLLVSLGFVAQMASPYFGLAITEALVIFVPAVVYVRLKQLPIAAALRWRPISPAGALLGVLIGVSGYGVAVCISLLTIPLIGPEPDNGLFHFASPWQLVVMMFCGAVLPGICEETLFRGAIQGTLERLGPIKAVGITSLLFALFHVNPWNFLPPLFLGVVFGIVALRARSTTPVMIPHASTNATSFLIAYLQLENEQLNAGVQILIVALAVVFVLVFCIYLLKTKRQAFQPGILAQAPAGISRRTFVATAFGTVALVGLILFAACTLLEMKRFRACTKAIVCFWSAGR